MMETFHITDSSRIKKVVFYDNRDVIITFKGEKYTGILPCQISTSGCSKRISKMENQ